MPYSYAKQDKDGYLLFTLSGEVESAEDLTVFTRSLMREAARCDCWRLLLDERTISRKVDQYDLMVFADRWIMDKPRSGVKLAAVYSPDDARRFPWIETILQNRSLIYKIFDDMAEAERWLTT